MTWVLCREAVKEVQAPGWKGVKEEQTLQQKGVNGSPELYWKVPERVQAEKMEAEPGKRL